MSSAPLTIVLARAKAGRGAYRLVVEQVGVDLPFGRIAAWRVSGSAPAVVCVHGAGVSSRELLPLLTALEGTRETWSVDLPGFGASAGPRRPLSLPELRQAVSCWLDAVGPARVVLLGCSFGCQVATAVALARPDLIAGLLLVGPTTDPHARSWPRQLGRWLRNARHEPGRLGSLTFRDYRDAGARQVLSAFSESLTDRLDDRLPHVDVPALVVRGEHDALVPQSWAEEVTRLLPHGRLVVFPGTAHMVPFAEPGRCGRAVDRFVSEFVAEEAP